MKEFSIGDVVTFEDDRLDGEWDVVNVDEASFGLMTLPLTVVLQDGVTRLLIGNCSHPEGKTVEVREIDADDPMFNIAPDGIKVVAKR